MAAAERKEMVGADDLDADWPLTEPPPATIYCEQVEDADYPPANVATIGLVEAASGEELRYFLGFDGPTATAAGSDQWMLPLADDLRSRNGDLTALTDRALSLCPALPD